MGVQIVLGYLALCLVAGIAGRNRRIGFWGFFFCSIITTPFLSLMFLFLAMPKRVRRLTPVVRPGPAPADELRRT